MALIMVWDCGRSRLRDTRDGGAVRPSVHAILIYARPVWRSVGFITTGFLPSFLSSFSPPSSHLTYAAIAMHAFYFPRRGTLCLSWAAGSISSGKETGDTDAQFCMTLLAQYRDGLKGGPVLLSNSQARAGRNFSQPGANLLVHLCL